MKLFLLLLAVVGVASQSAKSCGGPNDHLKNAVFSVSPDPIQKGQPLTITATGTLDEVLTAGKLDVNLAIKALGIVNEPVSTTAPFTLSPGIPTGPQKITIGPFTLPSVPGGVSVSGNITGVDGSGAPVFCLALDISLGHEDELASPLPIVDEALASASEAIIVATPRVGGPVTDCSGSSDHLQNRSLSTSGGVVSVSGSLDEEVGAGAVAVDLKVKVSFFSIPINMNIPFTISPGIKAGPIQATIGPAADRSASLLSMVFKPDIKVEVTGTVKVNDAKSSEIVCVSIDSS